MNIILIKCSRCRRYRLEDDFNRYDKKWKTCCKCSSYNKQLKLDKRCIKSCPYCKSDIHALKCND